MFIFRKGAYEAMQQRQMQNAGAAIHEVCGRLGVVLNQAQNYVYWKNANDSKDNPEAVSCYLSYLKALKELGECDQADMLVAFEE